MKIHVKICHKFQNLIIFHDPPAWCLPLVFQMVNATIERTISEANVAAMGTTMCIFAHEPATHLFSSDLVKLPVPLHDTLVQRSGLPSASPISIRICYLLTLIMHERNKKSQMWNKLITTLL